MASRYSDLRKKETDNKSRYSSIRSGLTPETVESRESEKSKALDVVRTARTAQAKQRNAENLIHGKPGKQSNDELSSIGMDFSSQFGPNSPIAQKGASLLQSANERKAEDAARRENMNAYEKWYEDNISDSFVGKSLDWLQGADRALSNTKGGILDSATIGATQGVGRHVLKGIDPGGKDLLPILEDRLDSTSYKVGQALGYIPPGAAIEKAIVKVGGKALGRLSPLASKAISLGAAGAIDAAAQEVGDVAFREGDFDPLNVALGAGVGGGLPVVGAAIKGGIINPLKNLAKNTAEGAVQGNLKAASDAVLSNTQQQPQSVRRTVSNGSVASQEPITATQTPKVENVSPKREPVVLDDLVRSRGHADVTPESIAQTYNTKKWYHGTGTDKLTADDLDPFVGNHESLFGQGVYLTDNPKIAEGYAKSRGKRGTPTVYESDVSVDKVLDLEKPITPDVSDAIMRVAKSLDYHDDGNISGIIQKEIQRGATPEQVITKLREEVKNVSHDLMIPTSEFVDTFQDLLVNLRRAGYDGITHTGGHRTGNEAHRVLIMLDPQNIHGEVKGPKRVNRFEKYELPQEEVATPKQTEEIPVHPVNEVNAPKESWFNKLFGTQGVGIAAGRNSGKELIDTHVVSNPREPLALRERVGELVDTSMQDYVDRFAPFKKIDDETYDAAMDSTRANNLANITIKDKFVDLEGNVLGASLKDVYSTVPRGQKHIADRYLIARDAVNRMERNQQVYADEKWFPKTSQEAAELVSKLETQYPWLKQFGDMWNQFNRNRQNLWVESGIASQNLIDTLRKTNPNYTPMFRQQQRKGLSAKLALNSSKSGFSGQKAPIKRAVGSFKKIIDPAQGMIETTASSYHAMMRNRAMQSLYKAVLRDPERYKGVIEIEDGVDAMKDDALKAINEAWTNNGPDGIADYLNNEVNEIFRRAKNTGKSGNASVTVMVDGHPVRMTVHDPSLLKAIDGITPPQLEGIMKIADVVSRGIKQSATGMLAPLQGARLALRDLPVAAAQSNDKKRFIFDVGHALVSQIGDWLPDFIPGTERLGRLAREYYRAGGGYEAYLKGDSRIRAAAWEITKDPILSGRNLLKQAKKYNPLAPFKALGDAMENIPRMAAYAAEMRKSGWKRTPENVRRAIDAGREATVNWSRRGAKTQGIEAFAPYTNAAIQGSYRVIKRFKEQPISATALILSVAAAKIAAYEKFKDDPDYQQRSKLEKGIPVSKTKDGKFVTVPVEPTEAYIADQVLNFYKWAKDKEKFPSAGENIQGGLEAFTPSIVSGPASILTSGNVKESVAKSAGGTVLDPVIALSTGKNYFGGDIVPREYQDGPTSLKYNETTSAAGRWAAENLGIDAFTFDYLANKFGGDISKVGNPLTSDVGKTDVKGNIIDQVNSRLKLLEDPVMRNNIADDYYDHIKIVSDAKAISERKGTPLPDWYQQAYDEVTSMKKNSVNKIVSELNAEKKEITRDTTLTAKERSDRLRDVQREINIIRIQGIKRLEELGVKR